MTDNLCEEPLVHRFFSIVGRLGVFGLLLSQDSELTLNQLRVLFRLHYRESVVMGEVADLLGVAQPTATGVIDRLVEKGLVERESDPADRRRVVVRLSAAGRERIQAIRCAGAKAAQAVFSRLDSLQREALLQALEPVYQLLMEEVASGQSDVEDET